MEMQISQRNRGSCVFICLDVGVDFNLAPCVFDLDFLDVAAWNG